MNELEDIKKILDDDEEIKESFKPNKKRFTIINIIVSTIFILLVGGAFFLVGLFGVIGIIAFTSESGEKELFAPIIFMIVGSIPLLIMIINIIGQFVRYKNTLYVITNKRFIIRSGFIGVDYRSINIENVLFVNVRVDFLDKLVKPNTGSITLGSAATPITSNNSNQVNQIFTFAHVENPYDAYKTIKSYLKTDKVGN